MKKAILTGAFLLVVPFASAADNIGGCGWGTKLFDGQQGIAPQVLAVTTNGTSGNQTFAITSGTSGCTQDGVVRSSWKTAMYIDSNMNKLARDMSTGQGESLEALASLLGMEDSDKAVFFSVAQSHFSVIFPSENVTSGEVLASLKEVLRANSQLAKYSEVI